MNSKITVICLLLVLGAATIAAGRPYEAQSFYSPTYRGYLLDWCLEWGEKCGEPAAQAWCREQRYERAIGWKIKPNIGARSATKVMIGGRICDHASCDGFEWISCERFGDKVRSLQACLDIGNRTGSAPPTCQGSQGHHYGKAGRSFHKGETVWILLRLKNLPVGNHVLTTAVNRNHQGHTSGSTSWAQRKEFTNRQTGWWFWFSSKARDSGQWTEHLYIDGEHLGYVSYCVDCVSWD